MTLEFRKRATCRTIGDFKYTRRPTLTNQWAIERSQWLGQSQVLDVWRVLQRRNKEWAPMSAHRTERAAIKACNQYAKVR